MDFGQQTAWRQALIEQANQASAAVVADWQAYGAAFDGGYFG